MYYQNQPSGLIEAGLYRAVFGKPRAVPRRQYRTPLQDPERASCFGGGTGSNKPELVRALEEFRALYNQHWLIERLGFEPPVRARQRLALQPAA